MKKIIIFLVFSALCALELPAQIVFTAGVNYTTGVPSGAPGSNGSRLRVDLLTGKLYEWSPTSMTWLALGQGVDKVSGCATPSYTPGIGQSDFVVNECTPTPQLFHYRAGVWRQIGGSPYTAGDGISIASNVITNTGDLDPTNELNASLTVVGNSLTLVDEGGFLTVPVSDIAPVQSVTAGTGISVSSTAGVATVANTGDTNAGDDVTGSGATPNLAYWVGTQTQAAASAAFWDNTNGRLGIGSSLPDAKLRVISTGNDIAANFTGTYTLTGSMSPTRFDYTLNPSTAHTGLFTAASYVIRPTGAQAKGLVVAQYNVITDPGAGAITAAYCSRNEIAPNGGGAIAASYITDNSAYNNSATANGIVVGLRNTIGGNYTTAYGSFSEVIAYGGYSPATAYGYYVAGISATNKYAFYSVNSAVPSYFAGDLGIGPGTTTAAGRLHIASSGSTSGTFGVIARNSSGSPVFAARDDVRIGIATESPAQTLHVAGTMRLTGSIGTATALMGRDGNNDISAVALSGASIAGGTLTMQNIGNTDLTLTGNRTLTAGSLGLTIFSSATTGSYTPFAVRTFSDGSNRSDYLLGEHSDGTDRFRIEARGAETTLNSLLGDWKASAGSTSAPSQGYVTVHNSTKSEQFIFRNNGAINYPNVAPASVVAGDLWRDASTMKFRGASATKVLATLEDDFMPDAISVRTTSFTLGGTGFAEIADANAGGFTITLGSSMKEGHTYLVKCRRNSTNTITLSADSGFTLELDGDSTIGLTFIACGAGGSGAAGNYKVYHIARAGSSIFIK